MRLLIDGERFFGASRLFCELSMYGIPASKNGYKLSFRLARFFYCVSETPLVFALIGIQN